MLVNVENKIVNLQKVTAISSIETNQRHFTFSFKIYLFGEKDITIEAVWYSINDHLEHKSKEEQYKTVRSKIEILRDKLIELWNENGPKIIKLEL